MAWLSPLHRHFADNHATGDNYQDELQIRSASLAGSHKRHIVRFPDMQGVAGFRPTPDRAPETLVQLARTGLDRAALS